jgi:hypothetical protein
MASNLPACPTVNVRHSPQFNPFHLRFPPSKSTNANSNPNANPAAQQPTHAGIQRGVDRNAVMMRSIIRHYFRRGCAPAVLCVMSFGAFFFGSESSILYEDNFRKANFCEARSCCRRISDSLSCLETFSLHFSAATGADPRLP